VITTAAERLHGSSMTAESGVIQTEVVSMRVQIYTVSGDR
jgi:hypothetical protein